ncbi:elongation factor P [candidate division WOR-3 bacterium]|nr:elongation factor P [candidate division WOR-3 bacterium]
MASLSDIGKNVTIKYDGRIYKIVDYQHVKPGKGAAFARAKLKNVETGQIVEDTLRDNDKFDLIRLERRKYQCLYPENGTYWFMDVDNYEQITVDLKVMGDKAKWLKENMECDLLYAEGKIVDAELPLFVELKVLETAPGYKGDTATAGTKPAIVEGGVKITVPLFINPGDMVRIDTRTDEYMERISK